MVNIIFGFRTKKNKNGTFTFVITRGKARKTPNRQGSFLDTKIVKTGTTTTRARALGKAKKQVLFLRRKRDSFNK